MRRYSCRHIDELDVAPAFRDALVAAGDVLGHDVTWNYQDGYHFRLGHGWTIALSLESADRIRVDACRWTRPLTTLWTFLGHDPDRLVEIVSELQDQVTRSKELEEGVL